MLEKLVRVANHLDRKGLFQETAVLDGIIVRASVFDSIKKLTNEVASVKKGSDQEKNQFAKKVIDFVKSVLQKLKGEKTAAANVSKKAIVMGLLALLGVVSHLVQDHKMKSELDALKQQAKGAVYVVSDSADEYLK